MPNRGSVVAQGGGTTGPSDPMQSWLQHILEGLDPQHDPERVCRVCMSILPDCCLLQRLLRPDEADAEEDDVDDLDYLESIRQAPHTSRG